MIVEFAGVRFGGASLPLIITAFESTLGSLRTNDAEAPFRHGTTPGRDWADAGVLTFTISTGYGVRTYEDAMSHADELSAAWGSGLDLGPGEMVPLRIELPGNRTRVVYGRPGRFAAPTHDVLSAQGKVEIIAEFRVQDPFVYAPDWTTTEISVIPRSTGGIVSPVVSPVVSTVTSGVAYRQITNSGAAPAVASVTFHGPATRPSLSVGGVEVGLTGSLAYDEAVVVDGRTRTALYSDGRSASSILERRSRIDQLKLESGTHELSFTADDRTGTAKVSVQLQSAHYSL